MTVPGETTVIQWILDTRNLWPGAERTAQLKDHARRALALLPKPDQDDVLKYLHVSDAKMALGSRLLKRYVISRYLPHIPWNQVTTTRDKETKKPIFISPDGSEPLIFNVSHQAGLVVLVAALHPKQGTALGVDVVCPTERRGRDHNMISKEGGWPAFVDIHAEVLCPVEVTNLCRLPSNSIPAIDRALRYFYILWCLREAYVKMTGEALLAPWLKSLEMRNFAPPEDAPIDQTEIWFHGRRLQDVDLQLVNVLDSFVVCTAAKRDCSGGKLELGDFEMLDVDELIAFAEKSSAN